MPAEIWAHHGLRGTRARKRPLVCQGAHFQNEDDSTRSHVGNDGFDREKLLVWTRMLQAYIAKDNYNKTCYFVLTRLSSIGFSKLVSTAALLSHCNEFLKITSAENVINCIN